MSKIVPINAYSAELQRLAEEALDALAVKWHLVGWPSEGPRFNLADHSIDYRPEALLFGCHLHANVWGPERGQGNTWARVGHFVVHEEFHLPEMPADICDQPKNEEPATDSETAE